MKIKFIKIFFFLPLAIFSHNVFSVSIIQDWNGPFEFLHGTVGLTNSNQYAITMTATQTNIRTLVVSEYSTRSGNTCTGSPSATATMTASADETFSSGVTYAATNDSSWYMVNNNGGGTAWKKVCTKYQYKDSGGTVLHEKSCAAWYSGASGGSVCSAGQCGQNSSCTDSW